MENNKPVQPRFITELDITPSQYKKLVAQLAQNPEFEQAFWGGKYTSPACLARALKIPMRSAWPVLALVVPLDLHTKLQGVAFRNTADIVQAVVVALLIFGMMAFLCMLTLLSVQKKMGCTAYWLNLVFALFQKPLKNKNSKSIQCRFLFFETEVLIEKRVDSQYIQDFSVPIPPKNIAYILPYSKLCVFQQAQLFSLLSVGNFTVLPVLASFPLCWNADKDNAKQEQLAQFLQEKLFPGLSNALPVDLSKQQPLFRRSLSLNTEQVDAFAKDAARSTSKLSETAQYFQSNVWVTYSLMVFWGICIVLAVSWIAPTVFDLSFNWQTVWFAAIVAASLFAGIHKFCRNILRVVLQADAKQKLDVAGMMNDEGIHCTMDFLQDGIWVQDLGDQTESAFFPYSLFLQSEKPFFRQQERKGLVFLQPSAHSCACIVWNGQLLEEREKQALHTIITDTSSDIKDV